MALDLQEQEQVAQFKAWWQSWGKYFVAVILLFVLAYLGYKGWQAYQVSQGEKISNLFFEIEKNEEDPKKALTIVSHLMEKYPSSAYTGRAALLGAKIYLSLHKSGNAQKQLKWVLQHATEPTLRDIARLHLAAILLDSKEYEEALSQLKQAEDDSYRGAFLEAKGDIYSESGKQKEAIEAYKQAYAQTKNDMTYRKLIEVKLDVLESVNR